MSAAVARRASALTVLAAAALTACTSGPAEAPRALAPLGSEPPTVAAATIGGITTAVLSENDARRPIYATWPQIPGASALTSALASATRDAVDQFKDDDPVYPSAVVPPEFNGTWAIAGAGGNIVGVRLSQYQFAGASGATSTTTTWTNISTQQVVRSADLLAGAAARQQVLESIVKRARESGLDPDATGMPAAEVLCSITFRTSGMLVATLDQGAISSYSRGVVTVPVPVTPAQLSPFGRAVRAAIMSGTSYQGLDGSAAVATEAPAAMATPSDAPSASGPSPAGSSTPAGRTSSAAKLNCHTDKCIALTFDGGPGPYTAQLLADLTGAGAKATFFVVGRNVAAAPGVVAQLARAGMAIGDQTWNHRDLTQLSTAEIQSELQRTAAEIRSATGSDPSLMRPPYGVSDARVAAAVGMPMIMWSADTGDWGAATSAAITERALAGAAPGAILLLHDTYAPTVAAVPGLVAALQARGYRLVTVPQLLGTDLTAGRAYYNA